MGNPEELNLLREQYERALASYEAICSGLNAHLRTGTRPSALDLQREQEAREVLEKARRLYLGTWMLP